MHPLYERLGGEAAIAAAVDRFYDRVIADPLLAPVFEGVDLERLRGHQRRFLTLAMGGPDAYAGRDLGTAHRRIAERHGLDDRHFDAVLGHLDASLDALGVAAGLRAEVRALAESVRAPVLGR